MDNPRLEQFINHLKAIRQNLDSLSYLPVIITRTFAKYQGYKDENEIAYLNLDYEYKSVEDFIGAAYILTSFLSLSNYYVEQIDHHTREVCSAIEKFQPDQSDQNTINLFYSNVSGRFTLPDPELEESLFDLTLPFMNNKKERFKEIYFSNHYAPNGVKYLKAIYGSIKEYYMVCDSARSFLDAIEKVLY
jgi:hypothetical protein